MQQARLPANNSVQRKVKFLSIMGGAYPKGSEWNFQCDPVNTPAFLYVDAATRLPADLTSMALRTERRSLPAQPLTLKATVNPTVYGMQLADTKQRPMWDTLSVLYAARGAAYQGTTYFSVSAPGTVDVNSTTGTDTWSADQDSGHYVLTNAAPVETFERILDAYTFHDGLLAMDPTPQA